MDLREKADQIITKNSRLKKRKIRKLAALSLGCTKNRIDTEEILGHLSGKGYILTDDRQSADIIIINTCSFIEDAQQESVNTLIGIAEEVKNEKNPIVIAAGCLVEIFGIDILKKIPEIDGAIGVHSYSKLDLLIRMIEAGIRTAVKLKPANSYCSFAPRALTTPVHSAFVKISEGCSNYCNYCLIPTIRGPQRSKSASEIVEEIKNLLSFGSREINLIAQDTTAYASEGLDLPGLVKKIMDIDQEFWLRIMYAYPSRIDHKLIELIASEKRICRYIDLPIQHASSKVLKLMGRSYDRETLCKLINRLKEKIPGISLRTTCMVGFPGENLRDFRELLSFLELYPFNNLGAFTYSVQKGTTAYEMTGQVPLRVSKKRLERLMAKQQDISFKINQNQIGKKMTILVDRPLTGNKDWYAGRTEMQAPEVDGITYFRYQGKLEAGTWIRAEIAAASSYNLLAVNPMIIDSPFLDV
ncbi:MAG: 30S ribosomal protein S12 methylthiotransferase RimO [Bacillota bacterium]|nr:30S ribosomal protein S12 methylthiotransferase RimO [Bacillota bacterium]